jgi:hypothetical protein
MLRFKINVHVKETVRAECPRHRKFDPSSDDKLNSETGCSTCADIRALESARVTLENAARAFERRAYHWRAANIIRAKNTINAKVVKPSEMT